MDEQGLYGQTLAMREGRDGALGPPRPLVPSDPGGASAPVVEDVEALVLHGSLHSRSGESRLRGLSQHSVRQCSAMWTRPMMPELGVQGQVMARQGRSQHTMLKLDTATMWNTSKSYSRPKVSSSHLQPRPPPLSAQNAEPHTPVASPIHGKPCGQYRLWQLCRAAGAHSFRLSGPRSEPRCESSRPVRTMWRAHCRSSPLSPQLGALITHALDASL